MTSIDELSSPDYVPCVRRKEHIPWGYLVDYTGIYKVRYENIDGKNTIVSQTPLAYTPFRLIRQLENPDTKEVMFEISFENKTVLVAGSDLMSKKGIAILAGYGVNTDVEKAKFLCAYLMEYRRENPLETSFVYDRMGWKDDGSFVLGNYRYTKDGRRQVTLTTKSKQIEAIRECGTIHGWIEAMSGLMMHRSMRFKLYNAVAAPLLRILGEKNHCLADCGDTSTGKSLTTGAAMSIYGEPRDLMLSGDSTRVGMERMVTQFCDLPVNLDDAQNIKKENLDPLIYMIANGTGKVRGAKAGGLQEVSSWYTVGLFTSETPLITESSYGGLGMRVIETKNGLGIKDEAAIKKYEYGIRNNFGVLAPELIRWINSNRDLVRELHHQSIESMRKMKQDTSPDSTASGIIGRMVNTYATILTAGKIFEMLWREFGGKTDNPEEIVIEIFQKAVSEKAGATYTERGLNHIISWIGANHSNFLNDGERTRVTSPTVDYAMKYKVYGDITETHFNLYPSELRAELERSKFSLERLIQDFYDAGYLETDKGKKQKTLWLEGSPQKVYSLKRKMIECETPDSDQKLS